MLNPRRVLSKAQILDHVWHYDFGGDASVVETYISYLRRKVDADGPALIHTVRGVGYALRLPKGYVLSLRARLLTATARPGRRGLLVSGVATYRYAERVPDRPGGPAARHRGARGRLRLQPPAFPDGAPTPPEGGSAPFPAGTYVAVIDEDGTMTEEQVFGFGQPTPSPPALPSGLPGSTSGGDAEQTFTVGAETGDVEYRVLAVPVADGTLVAAIPLTEVADTLGRLLLIELIVTVAVVGALAAVAWWLVRVGLRPLERMAGTADSIAAGNLSRRVEPATETTEVGRLGLALNAMLARIEEAFAERRASEERLRRFVADASHELRTPLTSVRGYAELFRRGAADHPEDLDNAMHRIEEEGTRMADIVEELSLLARLDEGRPIERAPVDLVTLTRAAIDAARVASPTHEIDLVAPRPVVAAVDPARVRRVLDNLLSNASTHTPPGAAVHVRVHTDRETAVLEVEDDGPGIPDADAPRIFERFYRVDASRSRASGGSGLGLSIVDAVVTAHGGTARYRRAPGGGALFEVRIPLDGRAPDAVLDDRTGPL